MFGRKQVEFMDCTSAYGRKVYLRSLTFVLYKAVEDLYPGTRLIIEAPVSKGYYFLLNGQEATLEVVQKLRQRMREIVAQGERFHRLEAPSEQVAALFRSQGLEGKALLIESLENSTATITNSTISMTTTTVRSCHRPTISMSLTS